MGQTLWAREAGPCSHGFAGPLPPAPGVGCRYCGSFAPRPANAATPKLTRSRHLQIPSYYSGKAEQVLSRLPALPPRDRALGKEAPGKVHYFGPWNDPVATLKK